MPALVPKRTCINLSSYHRHYHNNSSSPSLIYFPTLRISLASNAISFSFRLVAMELSSNNPAWVNQISSVLVNLAINPNCIATDTQKSIALKFFDQLQQNVCTSGPKSSNASPMSINGIPLLSRPDNSQSIFPLPIASQNPWPKPGMQFSEAYSPNPTFSALNDVLSLLQNKKTECEQHVSLDNMNPKDAQTYCSGTNSPNASSLSHFQQTKPSNAAKASSTSTFSSSWARSQQNASDLNKSPQHFAVQDLQDEALQELLFPVNSAATNNMNSEKSMSSNVTLKSKSSNGDFPTQALVMEAQGDTHDPNLDLLNVSDIFDGWDTGFRGTQRLDSAALLNEQNIGSCQDAFQPALVSSQLNPECSDPMAFDNLNLPNAEFIHSMNIWENKCPLQTNVFDVSELDELLSTIPNHESVSNLSALNPSYASSPVLNFDFFASTDQNSPKKTEESSAAELLTSCNSCALTESLKAGRQMECRALENVKAEVSMNTRKRKADSDDILSSSHGSAEKLEGSVDCDVESSEEKTSKKMLKSNVATSSHSQNQHNHAQPQPQAPAQPKAQAEIQAQGQPQVQAQAQLQPQVSVQAQSQLQTQTMAQDIQSEDVTCPLIKTRRRAEVTTSRAMASRMRRDKINNRLRTLYALVPNGKSWDTASMLDETIAYIKQLQDQAVEADCL